jgi:hypothetical protein
MCLGGDFGGGWGMAIYRALQHASFDPEHITVMASAFEDVCRELGLAARDDPLRDIVAKAIVRCAEKGERNIIRLRECAHDVPRG